jgi:hypothetical protein
MMKPNLNKLLPPPQLKPRHDNEKQNERKKGKRRHRSILDGYSRRDSCQE